MIEFQRLWYNKKIRIALSLFALLCFYYVGKGVGNYKAYLVETIQFEKFEKMRANHFNSYEQYAGTGFRVLWKLSPINILFNTMNKTYAKIKSDEIIEIQNSRRYGNRVNSRSLSYLLIIAGFLYLYLGFTVIHNSDYIKFLRKKRRVFGTILCRAGYLVLFVMIIFLISYFMMRFSGVNFSWHEVEIFLGYMLYTCLFLSTIYGLGVLSAFLVWEKKLAALALLLIFIVPVLLPDLLQQAKMESEEKINIEKISKLWEFEKKVKDFFEKRKNLSIDEIVLFSRKFIETFMNGDYKKNENLEKGILKKSEDERKKEEKIIIFFPSLYLNYLADELSINSNDDYIRFFNEVLEIRFRFMSYINEKRLKREKIVKPFEVDYFYPQKTILPTTYGISLFIMLDYLLLMGFLLYRFSRKYLKTSGIKRELPEWAEQIKPNQLNYKKEDKSLKEVYEAFLKDDDVSGLDGNHQFLLQYLNLPVKMACRDLEVDKEKFDHILNLFEMQMWTLINEKNVPYLYVAYGLAAESKMIVINDFLGNMNYSFYERFEEALKYSLKGNKTLLFLTSKLYKLKGEEKYFDREEAQQIDFRYHSLR